MNTCITKKTNIKRFKKFNNKQLTIKKSISIIKQFPQIKKTIRNLKFKLYFLPNLKKLIGFKDLPINFRLAKFKYRRLIASFYGWSYDANAVNYNLWLTLGLKRNISIPFNLFFRSITPRKNFKASINIHSWKFYGYLVKNSFLKRKNNLCLQSNLNSSFDLKLSDISIWNLRHLFLSNRLINLTLEDLDFTISTYHYKFDYYNNYAWRLGFYWIANENFRNPTFFIDGFDSKITFSPKKLLKRLFFFKKLKYFYNSLSFNWIQVIRHSNWPILHLLNKVYVVTFQRQLQMLAFHNSKLLTQFKTNFILFFIFVNLKKSCLNYYKCFFYELKKI